MNPPPTSFSGRRRSSVIDVNTPPILTSASPAPRKSSVCDSPPRQYAAPTTDDGGSAENIATRKASVWDDNTNTASRSTDSGYGAQPGNEGSTTLGWITGTELVSSPTSYDISSTIDHGSSASAENIATRKASAWDDNTGTGSMNSTRASVTGIAGRRSTACDDDDTCTASTRRASVTGIAGRRSTALDRPPWDLFSGAPPSNEGSTWDWMSEIVSMISNTNGDGDGLSSDKNRVYYVGNMNHVFETHNDQKSLAIVDVETIMYAYGVDKACVEEIFSKIDPKKSGIFNINSNNKQILVASIMNFSSPKEPLVNLRHASKCFRNNLLSPLHFAGYIIDVLRGRCIGNEPHFMILGMYSILGVLQGSTNRGLTTKDVEKFVSLWKVNNSDEAQDLISMIKDDHNGTISCWSFYNLLYRRNMFGKQRIEVFDIQGKQKSSMFFPLIDKDQDGFLSSADLSSFAATFGRYPSDEAIDRVTRKLDMDGDGKINVEDFCVAMELVLDGMAWEFWLVAILLTFEL
ncbi:hypothetical protein SOVF_101580 [Spinacia oleracea]|uniref:EF-hand domain-containing protein n=1 Tax=Spinacia oleracea TaxID=3562 RepID=A0A9R0JEI3_SPIOL|nr:uncharacterized protein LOC110805070 [Spinacia oleracea]KNA15067.1 hypothetical protein SOVF_101580 [Spinacia oleracea]